MQIPKNIMLVATVWLGLFTVQSAHASPVSMAAVSPIASPDVSIDFGNDSFPNGTTITNQYSGVTFGSGYVYADTPNTDPSVTFGVLVNAGSTYLGGGGTSLNPGSLYFGNGVTDAVFSFRGPTGMTTFYALLNGIVLEQFSAPIDFGVGASGRFYGFVNLLLFDEIQISMAPGNREFSFDNLQFNNAPSAVPLPAALPLFAAGLSAMGFMGWRRKRRAA